MTPNFNRAEQAQEAFPLPQPGLFADFDLGVGAVGLCEDFRGLPVDTKLALLADWQKGFERERSLAIVSFFRDVTGPLIGAAPMQKIAYFRKACAQAGIECPANLALLLQQV